MTCIRGTGFGFGGASCAGAFVPIRNVKRMRFFLRLEHYTKLNPFSFIKWPEKGFFVRLIKKRFYKRVGVELCDVFRLFAQADEFHRYIELVFYSDNDSAPCGAVKLG